MYICETFCVGFVDHSEKDTIGYILYLYELDEETVSLIYRYRGKLLLQGLDVFLEYKIHFSPHRTKIF